MHFYGIDIVNEMSKESGLSAVIKGKCPRCREGEMFAHGPFDVKHFSQMNERCASCGFRFEKEPGFFYGAMYVSYAFAVGLLLVVTAALYVLFDDPGLIVYISSVIGLSLILYPFNFRFSRIIFLHAFGGVKYDPSHIKG